MSAVHAITSIYELKEDMFHIDHRGNNLRFRLHEPLELWMNENCGSHSICPNQRIIIFFVPSDKDRFVETWDGIYQ